MIRFDTVTKRYDKGREALSNLSFEVAAGELLFLTGHSGAGKLIALIERPTRGQVLFEGRNIGRLHERHIPAHRRQIGMVFQDHKLLEDRSVFENIALPMVIAGYTQREIRGRVRAALDTVGLLDNEKHTPAMLSTGEQQRIGIARALVARPKLTGNLDPELSLDIMNLFRRFNEVGVTMLIATHDLGLVDQLGGRRIVLENGNDAGRLLVNAATRILQ